jgi:hypothetical protein
MCRFQCTIPKYVVDIMVLLFRFLVESIGGSTWGITDDGVDRILSFYGVQNVPPYYAIPSNCHGRVNEKQGSHERQSPSNLSYTFEPVNLFMHEPRTSKGERSVTFIFQVRHFIMHCPHFMRCQLPPLRTKS